MGSRTSKDVLEPQRSTLTSHVDRLNAKLQQIENRLEDLEVKYFAQVIDRMYRTLDADVRIRSVPGEDRGLVYRNVSAIIPAN